MNVGMENDPAPVQRERNERAGGVSNDYPPVLARLGVTAAQWEKLVRMTSRRFTRELDLMAKMFAEARRRGYRTANAPTAGALVAGPAVAQRALTLRMSCSTRVELRGGARCGRNARPATIDA